MFAILLLPLSNDLAKLSLLTGTLDLVDLPLRLGSGTTTSSFHRIVKNVVVAAPVRALVVVALRVSLGDHVSSHFLSFSLLSIRKYSIHQGQNLLDE
jgi:hypothetical protein